MGLLNDRMHKTRQEGGGLPEYTLDGGGVKPKRARRAKRKLRLSMRKAVTLTVLALLAASVYIPPALNRDQDVRALPSRQVAADISALVTAQAVLANAPDEDFSGDGLTNEQAARFGVDPYGIDFDGDGITNWAELYIFETNPRVHNRGTEWSIESVIAERDREAGRTVNTPVKIHNVVLWADDYTSRARSGVVRTIDGYRICNFKGWAQFPDGEVPYAVVNGYHVPLRQNGQGYYRLDGGDTAVRVFSRPLEKTNELSLFGLKLHLGGGFGDFLSLVLPSTGRGPLTSRSIAVMDIEGRMRRDAVIAAVTPRENPALPESRFARNHNRLADLAAAMQEVYDGRCVIVSLFSPQRGEGLALMYGYTSHGNLLVADIETGEELGAINVTEMAGRFLDRTGELQQYEWFTFEGLGFSAAAGDRIAFIHLS